MPWENKTVEELRKEFVASAHEDSNFSSLCREFGITRKTGYKWLRRAEEDLSFSDRSKRPHTLANRTAAETELRIVEVRSKHPGWGAKKIKCFLEQRGIDVPCIKTVNNILNRYGCISKEEALKHKAFIRFEKEQCNELWQADFKGEFRMQDGNYCYPLDILDDHSRFVLKLRPSANMSALVLPTFREAFCEYGMPNAVLSDNGAQFAGFRQGYTQFEKWLMNHDVLPIHGRIKHPQTQGKIERFHRTMDQELLNHYIPKDLADAEQVLAEWCNCYNYERPHEALGMKAPAQVYVPSVREYHDTISKYEYGGQFHTVRVNNWGYVRFASFQIYLSETMIDERVEFRPSPSEESFMVCYRNFSIAEFDVHTGKLLHRKIQRL